MNSRKNGLESTNGKNPAPDTCQPEKIEICCLPSRDDAISQAIKVSFLAVRRANVWVCQCGTQNTEWHCTSCAASLIRGLHCFVNLVGKVYGI